MERVVLIKHLIMYVRESGVVGGREECLLEIDSWRRVN